jgi:hypothetical protein
MSTNTSGTPVASDLQCFYSKNEGNHQDAQWHVSQIRISPVWKPQTSNLTSINDFISPSKAKALCSVI